MKTAKPRIPSPFDTAGIFGPREAAWAGGPGGGAGSGKRVAAASGAASAEAASGSERRFQGRRHARAHALTLAAAGTHTLARRRAARGRARRARARKGRGGGAPCRQADAPGRDKSPRASCPKALTWPRFWGTCCPRGGRGGWSASRALKACCTSPDSPSLTKRDAEACGKRTPTPDPKTAPGDHRTQSRLRSLNAQPGPFADLPPPTSAPQGEGRGPPSGSTSRIATPKESVWRSRWPC